MLHISCVSGAAMVRFLLDAMVNSLPNRKRPNNGGIAETHRQWKAHLPGIGLISSGELADGIQKAPITPVQFH